MAKSPIGKTANIVLPLAGIGILIGVGFAVYKKFFASQTQEEKDADFFGEKQSGARDAKGALGNTIDFFFGEGSAEKNRESSVNQEVIPNPQTSNTTPNLDGGGSFFGDLFGSISRFFNPAQEGQSSPTSEKQAADSTPSTLDPSGRSKAPRSPGDPPSADVIPPTGGNEKRGSGSSARPAFVDTNLNEFQRNRKVFGQKPKRGGRLPFGSRGQGKSPGNTTSNADNSTQRKSTPSTKDITTQQQQTSNSRALAARFRNLGTKTGTSNTSPKSSGSGSSSTASSDKDVKRTGGRSPGKSRSNARTTNSGTGTTDKTQTTPPVRRGGGRRRGNIRR